MSRSRQAIKKYVKANNKLGSVTDAAFNTHISKALHTGEENGVFDRPKGTSLALQYHEVAMLSSRQDASTNASRQGNVALRPLLSPRCILTVYLGASGPVKLKKPGDKPGDKPAAPAKATKPKAEKTEKVRVSLKYRGVYLRLTIANRRPPLPRKLPAQRRLPLRRRPQPRRLLQPRKPPPRKPHQRRLSLPLPPQQLKISHQWSWASPSPDA